MYINKILLTSDSVHYQYNIEYNKLMYNILSIQ